MSIKPKPNDMKWVVICRIGAFFGLIFSIFVLVTEATVIIDPKYTALYQVTIQFQIYAFRLLK